jgi:N-acetylglucosamine kinase-like BadF-type ATPase
MDHIQLSPILAKQIFQLAAQGDTVAQEVVNFTARELALNVNAVIRQLNFQKLSFEVILFGSTFKAGAIYLQPFKQTVLAFAPGAKFKKLHVPPVVGAVLLGAETIHLTNLLLRKNLVESTEKIMDNPNLPG